MFDIDWHSELDRVVRDMSSLVPRTLFGPAEPRIFFLHIQKCGGTSVIEALARLYRSANPIHERGMVHLDPHPAYRASKVVDMGMYTYRQQLAHYYLQNSDHAFVTGHFQVDGELVEEYTPEVDFVVLFRDPLKRWHSHYFFHRHKDRPEGRIDEPLDSYLETKRARDVGCDYVQLLTGHADESTDLAREDAVVERALECLDRFSVVGVLEEMERFVADVHETFGLELDIAHRNRNPASRSRREREMATWSDAQHKRIRELCAPNRRIYREVQKRLGFEG